MSVVKFKEAVVHIGLHKTGTSAIQQVLFDHREALASKYGIHFPGVVPNQTLWLVAMMGGEPNFALTNPMKGKPFIRQYSPEDAERRRSELIADLGAASVDKLILSGEGLSVFSFKGVYHFKQLVEELAEKVSIVIFLRHPLEWAVSFAQESVKHGEILDAINRSFPGFDFMQERLKPWEEIFGKSALRVVDYNQACKEPRGVLGAFCGEAGIPLGFLDEVDLSRRCNPSMSHSAILMLNELNKIHPWDGDISEHPMRSAGREMHVFSRVKGPPFRLSREVLDRIASESRQGCQYVADTFGIHYDPDQSHARTDEVLPEPFGPETIGSIASTMMEWDRSLVACAAHIAHLEGRVAERDDLERRNAELERENTELRSSIETGNVSPGRRVLKTLFSLGKRPFRRNDGENSKVL